MAEMPKLQVPFSVEQVARLCHEVNRVYCEALGDFSQKPWASAPDWQKASAIKGVWAHFDNPSLSPGASHDAWMKEKTAAGWKYGPKKDEAKKEHPCYMEYHELSHEEQVKDYLFKATVFACRPFMEQVPVRP